MCGIFAAFGPAARPEVLCACWRHMAARLAHRGPDGSGLALLPRDGAAPLSLPRLAFAEGGRRPSLRAGPATFDGCAGFIGHHRLAIIDPWPQSMQPLVDCTAGVALALNGEIYNYLELRDELGALGHRFETHGDGEVALRAYVQWGWRCLEHFNGDFALVIADRRRRVLLAARDRVGSRPLFWWAGGGLLVLASEVKAFPGLPGFEARLDEDVAFRYLVADFPTARTLERSFLGGVAPVPAASVLCWSLDDAAPCAPRAQRYWSPPRRGAEPAPRTLRAAAERFDALLADAVRLRLRADVPVAALLSGGLDSTAVVHHALAAGAEVPAYSALFPGTAADESSAITAVAARFGAEQRAMAIDGRELADDLTALVELQDEPFTTLNVYAQWLLVRRAADDGVRVLLDGSGADEILGGYGDHEIPALADAAGAGAASSDPAVERFRRLGPRALSAWHDRAQRERRTVPWLADGVRARLAPEASVDRPLDPSYKGRCGGSFLRHALRRSVTGGWMNKSIEWDARYLERSGMWCGVEGRSPFYDHRLIEFALGLPPRFVRSRGYSKLVLRAAMRGRLPAALRSSRVKVGFEFPFAALLRRDRAFRELLRDITADPGFGAEGLVDPAAVRAGLEAIIDGRSDDYNIWRPINLHLWCRRFRFCNGLAGAAA